MRYDAEDQGKKMCEDKHMDFLMIDIKDFDEINTLCVTTSPFKLYTYEVSLD